MPFARHGGFVLNLTVGLVAVLPHLPPPPPTPTPYTVTYVPCSLWWLLDTLRWTFVGDTLVPCCCAVTFIPYRSFYLGPLRVPACTTTAHLTLTYRYCVRLYHIFALAVITHLLRYRLPLLWLPLYCNVTILACPGYLVTTYAYTTYPTYPSPLVLVIYLHLLYLCALGWLPTAYPPPGSCHHAPVRSIPSYHLPHT